jgi:hypothetical protein
MNRLLLSLMTLGILVGGCSEKTTAPIAPPAAPRGLFSVTGDHRVTLVWLANTEADLTGYRIYEAPCARGDSCPYRPIAALPATATGTYVQYVVTGLTNGVTRFFAVSAVNRAGAESDLSYEDVFDTPRPAGTGLVLNNYLIYTSHIGYDFSASARTDSLGPPTDVFYGYYESPEGVIHQQVFVPDYSTDIQDAGFTTSLDAVDFAPDSGWSPSGTAEAVVGHAYVVWTRDNHYAKFRITSVQPATVTFDWAYQTDPGNRELRAGRAMDESRTGRRPIVWLPR